MAKGIQMKKTLAFLSFLSAGFLIILLIITSESTVPVRAVQESYQQGFQVDKVKAVDDNYALTHQEIVRLTEGFMSILVQETDLNGKVVHLNTLNELYKEFESVATKEAVKPYIEFYYTEEKDGLYLLPTETPPWFIPENNYEINQINDSKVIITQQNKVDLYGEYTIEIEFIYSDAWKISNITHR